MNASRIIGVLISSIFLFGGIGLFLFMRSTAPTAVSDPIDNGQQLLQAVMAIDNAASEPIASAHDLMHHITTVRTALYSEQLQNDMFFTEIIRIHRLLFSENALLANPFDIQHQNFIAQLALHREGDIFQTDIEVVNIFFPEPNYAFAHLSQTFNNLGVVNWVYFLVNEPDIGWKIETMFPANHNFEPFVAN